MITVFSIIVLLIDRFHELANDQGYTLYPLDFFLCTNQFPLQTPSDLGQQRALCNVTKAEQTFVHP